ncbi:hypothetical protein RN51_00152 [Microbacterium oxydans]|uniref:Uncharacterized protein n=1 Tax=Microbacterium oxydans TaxID=82380 RepID=A0A0F0L2A2_9MICO|nr:hypothetical protein RN51_00152 [Microbacterium oxydans]
MWPNNVQDVPVLTEVSPVTVTADDAVKAAFSQGADTPSAAAIGSLNSPVNITAASRNTPIDARAGERRGISATHLRGPHNRFFDSEGSGRITSSSYRVAEHR